MKALVILSMINFSLSMKEYGEYKLYRQAGGLLYDYSGNNFHGRNGNQVLPDTNDGYYTDRGIYLDGVSNYIVPHSLEFSSGPTLPRNWGFSIWIFILTKGPIVHRRSTQGNVSYSLKLVGSTLDIKINDCGSSSCTLKSYSRTYNYPTCNVYTDEWMLMSFRMDGDEDIYFYKGSSVVRSMELEDRDYGDNNSQSLTYIGTDLSSYTRAFIYYAQFFRGSISWSTLRQTSGCNGYCYFNSSPNNSLCSCGDCTIHPSTLCISSCSDHLKAADCSTDNSSCNGIMNTSGSCSTCPDNEWPVCDFEGLNNLEDTLCNASCNGCYSPNDCLGCTANHMNSSGGVCSCPTNSSQVGDDCVCASGYRMFFASVYTCQACAFPCSECSISEFYCDACVQTGANLSSGLCSCPANSTSQSSLCQCNPGYVLEYESSLYQCSACTHPCAECSGTKTSCTACATSYNLSGSICVCPANASVVSTNCECAAGYILEFISPSYQCTACVSPCSECSGTTSTCTLCVATFNLNASACECPTNATVVGSQCQCSVGLAIAFTTEYVCSPCQSPCDDCTGSVTTCTSCVSTFNLSGNTCVCPTNASVVSTDCECVAGYILEFISPSYQCTACVSPCSECSGTTSTCTLCVATFNLNASACECPTNATVVGSQCQCSVGLAIAFTTEYVCSPCQSPCDDCTGSVTTCTSCVSTFNLSGNTCVCPANASVVSTDCECVAGYILEFISPSYQCSACISPCSECSGTTSTCTACVVGFNLNGAVCECPTDATAVGNQCVCSAGLVLGFTTEYECGPCQFPCEECTGLATTCTTCVTTFNLNVDVCECPANSAVVNDSCECSSGYFMENPSSYVCTACISPCSECSGDPSSCTECVIGFNLNGTLCECPTSATQVGNQCVCPTEFALVLNTEYECAPCESPCEECTGSTTTCTTCVTTFNLNVDVCECPANSAVFNDSCECSSGYFMENPSSYVCTACISPCSECLGDPSSCTECVHSFNLNVSLCECPANAVVSGDVCVCPSYFAIDLVGSSYQCSSCQAPCDDCSGSITTCNSCIETFNLDNTECQCPANASVVNNACRCSDGYILGVNSGAYVCLQCSYPCLKCSGNVFTCTECAYGNLEFGSCSCPSNSSLETDTCVCETGYVMTISESTYTCIECKIERANMVNNVCTCPENSELVSNECKCVDGYIMETIEEIHMCIECESPCSTCETSTDYCLSCEFSNYLVYLGECSCPADSTLQENSCVCNDGFTREDLKCVQVQEDFLESLKKPEKIVLSALIAAMAVSTLLLSDPSSVWMILNNVQILTYLPLHRFVIPERVHETCNAFRISSMLPNIPELLYTDESDSNGIPGDWVEEGFDGTSFFFNIGEIFLVLGLQAFHFVLILVLTCISKSRFQRFLKEFKYNILFRIWVEIYIEVLAASIISFHQLILKKYSAMSVIGGSVFVIQALSVPYYFLKFNGLRKKFEDLDSETVSKYNAMFYEFEDDTSDLSFCFYPYFLARRLIYILGLYYLGDSPLLQLTLSSMLALLQIFILTHIVKFKDKWNQRITVIIEILFELLFVLILCFNSEIPPSASTIIEYLSLGIVYTIGGLLVMNHFIRITITIATLCRRIRISPDRSDVRPKYYNECNNNSLVFVRPENILPDQTFNKDVNLVINDIY